MSYKLTVCYDFDGVIHSYTSRWGGATVIPDPPVPGAMASMYAMFKEGFQVAVYSSRSAEPGGIEAMQAYVIQHMEDYLREARQGLIPEYATGLVRKDFLWPTSKPPAHLSIDDRGVLFTGTFPTLEFVKNFKPWNKP
jgi:hypothetical protein